MEEGHATSTNVVFQFHEAESFREFDQRKRHIQCGGESIPLPVIRSAPSLHQQCSIDVANRTFQRGNRGCGQTDLLYHGV